MLEFKTTTKVGPVIDKQTPCNWMECIGMINCFKCPAYTVTELMTETEALKFINKGLKCGK